MMEECIDLARMNIIPSGREFMKEVGMHQLKYLYRKEKNAKAKLRLLAAMMRKDGKEFPEIAEHMQIAQSTLSDWLKRLHIHGLARLYDKKKPGAKPFLAYERMKELRSDLINGPQKNGFNQALWTTRMVMEHVRRKYGIEYKARSMRDVLYRLGFSSKKPRPTHYKANRKHWATFKKMPARLSENILQKDTNYSVLTSQHTA